MKKLFLFLFSFLVFLPRYAYAHCPLCTGAMVAGVAATRYFGISDNIVGIFVGGLIISTALWFNRSKLKKKYIPLPNLFIATAIWLITILSFYKGGLFVGHGLTMGINSLLFGIAIGSVLTLLGPMVSGYIKKKNSAKVLFPFQTITITVGLLIIASGIIFLIF